MTDPALFALSAVVLFLNVVLTVLVLGLMKLNGVSKKVIWSTGVVAALWLGYLSLALPSGNFLPATMDSLIYFTVVLGWVGVVGALIFLTPMRRAFLVLPQESLLIPQGLRSFFGATFIAQAGLGLMPLEGLLFGFMHVGTGFFCLLAAIMWLKAQGKFAVYFANVFGLADIFITAIMIGFVSFDQIGVAHNMNIAVFWAAPIYFWLHLFSIYKAMQTQSLYQERKN